MSFGKTFRFYHQVVLSAFAISLTVCQWRFEDVPTTDQRGIVQGARNIKTKDLRPLDLEEHPFSPQLLGPSFTLEPVPDSKEQWSYRLHYLGHLQARRLSVTWNETAMDLHPAQSTELVFPCQDKVQNKLELAWVSAMDGQEKKQAFHVVCPQNFDLRRSEDEKRLQSLIEQAPDESSVVIGYLTLAAKNYSFKMRQKHLSIWIYHLRSNLDDTSPEWRFSLAPEAFPELVSTLRDIHLRSEWRRLEKEYPLFHQILPELKQRYQSSFTGQGVSLHNVTPQLYVYIHNQRGRLRVVSQSTTGPAAISGAELAPDFYKNVVSRPAPAGADGALGTFKKEDYHKPHACRSSTEAEGGCETIVPYCKVESQGTPGKPGQPGTIPGIPGLNGFPAIPGPQIYMDTRELVADSSLDVTFHPAPAASKGGMGSPGQPGGAGGKGGAETCKFDGNGLAPDKRHPDGPAGANAPAGSNGKDGSPITCSPLGIYAAGKPLPQQEGTPSDPCKQYRRISLQAHFVLIGQSLKTGSWVLPVEKKSSEEQEKSYFAWRRGLWLSPDFFKDSQGENPFIMPSHPQRGGRTAVQEYQEHTGTDHIGPRQEL